MNEMIFEILRVVLMFSIFLVTCYLIPWLKVRIGQDRLAEVTTWVNTAVLMAQQAHKEETPQDRKAIVTEALRDLLIQKNISISDDQLDMLIEAAVKAMKMEENKGTV